MFSGLRCAIFAGMNPAANLIAIQKRIEAACARANRDPAAVTLLPVSKSQPPDAVRAVAGLGLNLFGENKVQEAKAKIPLCPGHLHWHLIGHLQRNKIEPTLPLVSLIHSVDSIRLIEALQVEAGKREQTLPVLLEINASREANKHGFAPEEVSALLPRLSELRHVRIDGLMAMAAFEEDPLPLPCPADVNDYLMHLQFRLKVFSGLSYFYVQPASVEMIGMPAEVPYDERIYLAGFNLNGVPATDRIVLEVLDPAGARISRFHLELQ